ncbi:MAG: hypothetical protein QOF98_2815, partial [Streptomyces sp.]|nr:hypothetical protein [Streptomyces sp.]
MTETTVTEPTVAGIFAGMFDDAALFPPGNLPFADALPAHHTHHSAWYAELAGPFVVPVPRLDELAARFDGRPLRISLTMPDGPAVAAEAVARIAELGSVELESVEVALPTGD